MMFTNNLFEMVNIFIRDLSVNKCGNKVLNKVFVFCVGLFVSLTIPRPTCHSGQLSPSIGLYISIEAQYCQQALKPLKGPSMGYSLDSAMNVELRMHSQSTFYDQAHKGSITE